MSGTGVLETNKKWLKRYINLVKPMKPYGNLFETIISLFSYLVTPFVDGKIPPGILAITWHHGVGEVPGSVEMIQRSLPELPKPSRTP